MLTETLTVQAVYSNCNEDWRLGDFSWRLRPIVQSKQTLRVFISVALAAWTEATLDHHTTLMGVLLEGLPHWTMAKWTTSIKPYAIS